MTGVSSFTGAAFAAELARRGIAVVAPLTRRLDDYKASRRERIRALPAEVKVLEDAPVGSEALRREVSQSGSFDAFLLHHAVVDGYRSDAFDIPLAVARATKGARQLTSLVSSLGVKQAVVTRSIFEAGQGLTERPGPIGAYAVAKTATVETWKLEFENEGISVSEFTITNPIGAGEEPRLTAYLVRSWQAGVVPTLRAPHLVRDNVPVGLLASAYASHVERMLSGFAFSYSPSFWVGSNRAFAEKVAREFGSRSGVAAYPLQEARTLTRSEPRVRIGLEELDAEEVWTEHGFWDEYYHYYYGGPSGRFSMGNNDF